MKLDKPEFHEGDLSIKLHVAALSHLHIANEMPHEKGADHWLGTLFEFNTSRIDIQELVEAATRVVEK